MKKLIIIPFLFICLILSATTYYVAPNGDDDTGNGSISNPWGTWKFGMEKLNTGDTLYIRGGVYYPTSTVYIYGSTGSKNGTKSDPICVFAYPDDYNAGNVPILDCNGLYRAEGFYLDSKSYWILKGLTVRHARQDGSTNDIRGIQLYNCNQIHFIQCVSHDNGGPGYKSVNCDTIYFTRCDAYNNCDSLAVAPSKLGGAADGFQADNTASKWSMIYYTECRAWNNSDDGFGHGYKTKTVINKCWAIANGHQLDGDGRGITVGQNWHSQPPSEQHIIKNCLSVYNKSQGFRINDNRTPYLADVRCYNNTAAFNGEWGFRGQYGDPPVSTVIFRNNIAFPHSQQISWNVDAAYSMEAGMGDIHDHNSWDIEVTVTDADFLLVDSTGITAARQADGSFPDNNCYNQFLHLASTSDLIDVGTDVGYGDDIGAFQYEETGVGPLVVFTTIVYPHDTWALAGGNVYDDGGGTVDSRGVCWSESENPTIADSHTSDGTGTGVYSSTLTGLIEGTTYHARAYAHNEVGYGYGADVEFETLTSGGGETIVFHNGKMIFHNGKIIVH